jgi:hypothetical protein
MSITTHASRLALIAAALCAAAATAAAKPRRVVILDFDGPRQLADAGRSSVMTALGSSYDVVATRRWEQARAAAAQQTHGPAQWSRAARQSGVDAVIEGWVQDEGRRKILNVVVREARNGREFDTISVRLDARTGVSTETTRRLQASLDEVLDWIDAGDHDPAPSTIPVIDAKNLGPARPAPGEDRARVRIRRQVIDDEDAARDDEDLVERTPRRRPGRVAEAEAEPEPDADADADAPGTRSPDAEADDASGDPREAPEREGRRVEVSIAARDASAMETLFPQHSDEHKEIFGEKATHVPRPTPRFMIDAGPYYGSRSLIWDHDPDADVQQFAGVSSKGFAVNAAIYPLPTRAVDGVMSGFGFTGSLHHSMGSTVVSDEGDVIQEYVINQNGWELGGHYRAALGDLVAIDGSAYYGNQTYEIVDASVNFETPDTKYSYLGVAAHLDLSITDRALVGFGARYFTVLDPGDLASTAFYGPASAAGLGLDGSFLIPLPANLYVRGQLSYQRISLELSGGGDITDAEGLTSGTDSLVLGNVNLGIAF